MAGRFNPGRGKKSGGSDCWAVGGAILCLKEGEGGAISKSVIPVARRPRGCKWLHGLRGCNLTGKIPIPTLCFGW